MVVEQRFLQSLVDSLGLPVLVLPSQLLALTYHQYCLCSTVYLRHIHKSKRHVSSAYSTGCDIAAVVVAIAAVFAQIVQQHCSSCEALTVKQTGIHYTQTAATSAAVNSSSCNGSYTNTYNAAAYKPHLAQSLALL
jgi:hypothetical protein